MGLFLFCSFLFIAACSFRLCLPCVWHSLFILTHAQCLKLFVSTDARQACRRGVTGKHYGRVSQRYKFESRRGQWALFSLIPSALSFVFLWHASSDSAEVLADAWRSSPADRSWSVSCMIVSGSSWRVSVWSVFSTDTRRACRRGVIESTIPTMGAYPRGTGSNPVEGNGYFFPSCRQLYLSSFSDTHTHRHSWRSFRSIRQSASFSLLLLFFPLCTGPGTHCHP